MTPDTFERAVSIAARAFENGRRSDTDELYLAHSLDVAQKLGPHATALELSTAVLHDVLEETDWTADDLADAGINGTVLEAVKSLTRRPDEDDNQFLARICATPGAVGVAARRVKLADVRANLASASGAKRTAPVPHSLLSLCGCGAVAELGAELVAPQRWNGGAELTARGARVPERCGSKPRARAVRYSKELAAAWARARAGTTSQAWIGDGPTGAHRPLSPLTLPLRLWQGGGGPTCLCDMMTPAGG